MAPLVTTGISDWVAMAARSDPRGRCLVRASGEVVTFEQAAADVAALAAGLLRGGLDRGDRIAVMGTDSVEQVLLMLAGMRIGATLVPLNYRLAPDELFVLLDATKPAAVFAEARYEADVQSAVDRLELPPRFVAGIDAPFGRSGDVRSLIASWAGSGFTGNRAEDEDIVVIALTSGTTGRPKGVLQSQRMLKAITHNCVVELSLQRDELLYSGAPLFHVAGLGHFLCGLARGAATLLVPQFDADVVLGWMQREVTRCVLMPTMVQALVEHPEARRSRYPSLRGIMYGGSSIPVAAIRDMADIFGCGLYNGFGAGTEAGGQTMLMPEDHRRAFAGEDHLLGSIGRAMYGVEVKICDPLGDEVPTGTIGEIYSRSDGVMSGYLDQPEATRGRITDGWFHGGDLAHVDADGYLYLSGRSDDMFIRGGENVYPAEIEEVIAAHPSVADVAVLGRPDARWGEIVCAVVVLRPGVPLELEELRRHCRTRLAAYKAPEVLRIVGHLPKNATGKTVKSQLKDIVT